MPLPKLISEIAGDPMIDEGASLLWRIARRADELVQETRRAPGLNRECWLIAEREALGRPAEIPPLSSHENAAR